MRTSWRRLLLVLLLALPLACSAEEAPVVTDACQILSSLPGCQIFPVTGPFTSRKASVLLVVERSSRLLRLLPGSSQTQWEALRSGLAASLQKADLAVNFALLAYPSHESTGGCGPNCCFMLEADSAVRGPLAADTAPRIVEVLLSDEPEGEAPIAAALTTARQYLTDFARPAEGDAFVLLIAGGGPDCGGAGTCAASECVPNLEDRCAAADNCCGNEGFGCLDVAQVSESIASLSADGIQTFVVGLSGAAGFASAFDAFAQAGGRANPAGPHAYYAATSAPEIEQTVSQIVNQLRGRCEGGLERAPPASAGLRLAVECEPVAKNFALDVAQSPARLVLESDLCAELGAASPPRLALVAGCGQ